ncbi:hypothetical protein AHAS_Ahas19G0272400 [Arachis hypogaea]
MSQITNMYNLLPIGLRERPSIGGKQSAACYSFRISTFLGMYSRRPFTRSTFLSLQGKRRRWNLCS